jgi:hypothetical protein
MLFKRGFDARRKVLLDKMKKKDPEETDKDKVLLNPASKKVYYFVEGVCKGYYDSITLCGTTLGLSRAGVKKAIESGMLLDNGFVLKLTDK